MKRILTCMMVLALMVLAALPAQAAESDSGILIDGQELTFDVQPQVVDGVLMVPVRFVAEAVKGQVTWNDEAQAATITAGDRIVVFTVGKATVLLDGREVHLATEVVLQDDRTLVPASFLMTFFGERLTITNPAVRDPKAVELILKSNEATPKNADMVMQQTVHITDGMMTIDIAADVEGQIRGTELLMTTRMKSLMLPPGAGDVSMAFKGGKQYIKVGDTPWEAVPGAVDIEALTQQLSATSELTDANAVANLILEAHLGEARTVDGRSLQDVVVTYDVDMLMDLVGGLLPADMPAGLMTIDRLTSVLTIDLATGAAVGQKTDMAMAISAEGQSLRMELQQDGTITPNDTPIAWPADLTEEAPAPDEAAPEKIPEAAPEAAPKN